MGKLVILSRSNQAFKDRLEAGELLARELSQYRGRNAVVLGIPRGGIVVAQVLARALEAELDIILSHKLRTPGQPELAMGSVSEGGDVYINEHIIREIGIDSRLIESEKDYWMAELARRARTIREVRPRVSLQNRIVIITDDGVATGATAQTSVQAARQQGPDRLIVAMPVGSEESLRRLSADADEVVCLRVPPFFFAIGQFYSRFEQVSDEEMLDILKEEHRRTQIAGAKK